MIIIEFYDGQGLGNQLWVYAVMRYIARKLNMSFVVLSPEKFKAKDFLDIDYGENNKTDIMLKINNQEINYFKEKAFLDLDFYAFCIDYDSKVLDIKEFTKIDGYFQSEKYFFNDYEFVKTIFPIKSNLMNEKLVDEKTCILNIRGGEYTGNINLILPKSYWLNAMNNMKKLHKIEIFVIVTDDHEYSKRLFPELKIIKKGIAESYIALHQAKYLIVSNSSFSYFPIKTQKDKPCVIAPKYWARFNNEHKRWVSPANLYQDWFWQDYDGKLFSYHECLDEYEKNMNYYTNNYNVLVKDDILIHFNSFSIKKYIPKGIKELLKMILPYELLKKIARKIR